MKKHVALLALFLLSGFLVSNSQNVLPADGNYQCAQEELMARLLGSDPQLLARHLAIEQNRYNDALNGTGIPGSRSTVLYTLPVVVHIIHNNGSENVSDAQVIQGIADLNEAYANVGYYDSTSGVNTQIQFCLAKRDPNGQLTTGITRNVSNMTNVDINTSDIALKNLNRWNPYCYVNIWLVRSICSGGSCNGIAGYAYFPSAHGRNMDGLVCRADYFGSSKERSTLQIHEMGHYLGLYHIFQGGCTNNNCLTDGDKVCDTPPDNSTAYVPCPAVVNSCTTDALSGFTTDQSDLFQAYMDYSTRACKSVFTQGQVDRMLWSIANVRSSLLGCQSCLDPCVNPATAQFSSDSNNIGIGGTVNFTNTSSNATTYTWSENGVQFSTATNPSRTFNTAGVFIITLRADNSDPNCFDEVSDTITVTCPVVAGFTQSAFQISPGQSVTFTNSSTGATTYSWVVDGVVMATTTNYTHTFNLSGDYSVYLIASNGGCADTSSILNFVHVGGGCNSHFTYSPANPSTCNPVTFIADTTCNYSNYHWSFCDFDSVGLPTTQEWPLGPLGYNLPVGNSLYRDKDGKYYGFVADYNNNVDSLRYFRVDFGSSMSNTPVFHRLYISGITDIRNHSISIMEVNGIYYAFMVNNTVLYRAKIGPDITNDTFTATVVTGLGNNLSWGHKGQIIRETNNYWIILCDRNNGHLIVGYLGSNIENNVLQFTTHRNGTGDDQYFAFQYMRVKGKSYIFAPDFINGKISRYDFGNSLANAPVVTNMNTLGTGLPLDINLFQNCNGSFDGYLPKENSSDHKLFHMDSITATPVLRATFPGSIPRISGLSNFLVSDIGVTCLAVRAYDQKLMSMNFGTCNTTNAYSLDKFPPPVAFTTAGTRHVRLIVDEGLPTESSFCDEVTVSAVNNNILELGPDTTICFQTPVVISAGPGFTGYQWQNGYTDSVITVYTPGTYSVTVTDYCGQTFTDSKTVIEDSSTQIILSDTIICEQDSVLLQGPGGFASYQWSPATGLLCPNCQNTYASPSQTTVYTLYARTNKNCLSIGAQTVAVTSCTGMKELPDIGLLFVRPNPVKDKLEIGMTGEDGHYTLRLYNPIGQLMISAQAGIITNHRGEMTLDVGSLTAGIYMLEIKHENGNALVRKVVKD